MIKIQSILIRPTLHLTNPPVDQETGGWVRYLDDWVMQVMRAQTELLELVTTNESRTPCYHGTTLW